MKQAHLTIPMTFIVSCIVFLNQISFAAPKCNKSIIFLPQTHADVIQGGRKIPAEFAEEIAQSQFLIAKFLEAHSNIPIFSEQVDTDQSLKNASPDLLKLAVIYHQVFPNGVPSNYSALNQDQKFRLSDGGADATELLLGKIPLLHKVVANEQEQNSFFDPLIDWVKKHPNQPFPPDLDHRILYDREEAALREINQFFSTHPAEKQVILIYGAAHNFFAHSNSFDPSCIKVPPNFHSPFGK